MNEPPAADGAALELIADRSVCTPRYCALNSTLATSSVRSTGGFKLATRNPW
jgi:hypothetical protein